MMDKVTLPENVIDDVVAALNRAIGLAMHKAPELVEGFTGTANKLDDAINAALSKEKG